MRERKIDIIKIDNLPIYHRFDGRKEIPMKNNASPETRSSVFNENKIAFSFAAISDIHIGNDPNKRDERHFENALLQIKAHGVHAVLVAGDLINAGGYGGKYAQMYDYKRVYESVFDPKETPMVHAVGNHDVKWSAESKAYSDILNGMLGEDYFLTDIDHDILSTEGNRHCVIGGYHILTLLPVTYTNVTFTEQTKTWLDKTLAQITAADPNTYVLVFTHPMIYDTVYGSTLGREPGSALTDMWVTSDITDILSKYNQVVTFGGHLHFPLNDPRSIMQTEFTALGCGSVNYMAIEDGGYVNMASATTMKDKYEFSQGLICEIDENGNMRIHRMDFYNQTTIDTPWEISYPTADGAHLKKYGKDRGYPENNAAPTLSEIETSLDEVDENGQRIVTVEFAAAKDDTFAHHYTMEIKQVTTGETYKSFRILSDFYRAKTPELMKKTLSHRFRVQAPNEYEIILTAYDSWGAASEPLSHRFKA